MAIKNMKKEVKIQFMICKFIAKEKLKTKMREYKIRSDYYGNKFIISQDMRHLFLAAMYDRANNRVFEIYYKMIN